MSRRAAPGGDMGRHMAKVAVKRDTIAEHAVKDWMEAVLGESFPPGCTYEGALRNGVLLCRMMNKIVPESITKIHPSDASDFKLMENSARFTAAALRHLHVPELDIFQTVDLWECRNIPQVTQCIYAVARRAQQLPDWSGPTLKERKVKINDAVDPDSPYATIT